MSYRGRASLLTGLFLLSCGRLLFVITLTRILSLFLSDHHTLLVVSGVVLGLGLGGLLRGDRVSSLGTRCLGHRARSRDEVPGDCTLAAGIGRFGL